MYGTYVRHYYLYYLYTSGVRTLSMYESAHVYVDVHTCVLYHSHIFGVRMQVRMYIFNKLQKYIYDAREAQKYTKSKQCLCPSTGQSSAQFSDFNIAEIPVYTQKWQCLLS
jgi:hypothetical protein